METKEKQLKTLSDTVDLMRQKPHLPLEMVILLEKTATLQLNCSDGISLDYSRLNDAGLAIDTAHAEKTAGRILDMIGQQADKMPESLVKAADLIKHELDGNTLDFKAAADEVMSQDGPILEVWSRKTADAPDALRFIVLAALEPSFRAGVETLAELKGIDKESIHSSGACPVCGHPPYILQLKGQEGKRYAVCSLCRFEYRIRRLACTACDTSDPESIKYFKVDKEPGFRVETCDQCTTYIKTIDFRQLDREPFAPLNDLESLPLDFVAAEKGYTRVGPSVWGI